MPAPSDGLRKLHAVPFSELPVDDIIVINHQHALNPDVERAGDILERTSRKSWCQSRIPPYTIGIEN